LRITGVVASRLFSKAVPSAVPATIPALPSSRSFVRPVSMFFFASESLSLLGGA
jgi:hypothetical protein